MLERLPIDAIEVSFREQVCAATKPVIVVAPTGSGKSTRLPIWLADCFADKPVLVVEPRRVACRSLATYVAQLLNTKVGDKVGYKIRFDNCASEQTRILFVTPGVALRLLQQSDAFQFSAVVIDEFHERGWETDLFLSLLQWKLHAGSITMPWVITSATLEGRELARALDAALLESLGRSFPVDIRYVGGAPNPTGYELEQRVFDALKDHWNPSSHEQGDVLVFLPGKREIDACYAKLRGWASKVGVELHKVHGSLPVDEVVGKLSRQSNQSDAHRVFLATNVAETSLTIPSITLVIDSGLVRLKTHRSGRSGLVLQSTSLASMDQRAGRAGRVAPGTCLRLWDPAYQAKPSIAPEVMRIELDDVFAQAVACGVPLDEVQGLLWPTTPPNFASEQAMDRLKNIGYVRGDNGCLSNFGKQLVQLPVSIHDARLLVDVPQEWSGAVADLVALMQMRSSVYGVVASGGEAAERIQNAREDLWDEHGVSDEVYAELVALRYGHIQRHGLHPNRIQEARNIAESLRSLIGCDVFKSQHDQEPLPASDVLGNYLVQRWPESGFVLRERAQRKARGEAPQKRGKVMRLEEPWSNNACELMVTPYPRWGGPERDTKKWPVAGLVLDMEWLGRKGGIQGVGRLVLPSSYGQLAEARLGVLEVGQVRVEKEHEAMMIYAVQKRVLGGVVIDESEHALEGQALREVAAKLILEGRLMGKVGERLLDDVHLAKIIYAWPGSASEEKGTLETLLGFAEPENYLIDRLQTLGVERSEDFALLSEGDFLLDLETLLDIPSWELESFREDFPRRWTYQKAIYDCWVNPKIKLVKLTPYRAGGTGGREPDKMTIPGFRGFRVQYERGNRVVKLR